VIGNGTLTKCYSKATHDSHVAEHAEDGAGRQAAKLPNPCGEAASGLTERRRRRTDRAWVIGFEGSLSATASDCFKGFAAS
jgi:hypothetical protein